MDKVNMGQICTLITDYVANGSFASLHNNVKYLDSGYARLIRLVDYHNNFDSSNAVYISKNSYEFLSKSKIYGGEIIISNVGENFGETFLAPFLDCPMSLAPNAIMIKTNQVDKYIYYYFTSPIGFSSLRSLAGGSAVPKFNKTEFKKLEINIHNRVEQQHIVDTIGSVDDLIERIDSVCDKFTNYLQQVYGFYKERCDNYVELSQLVIKTGKTCKNHEWYGKNVVDLSTMKSEKIFVDSFSDGSSFKTNIKTLNNFDMVYGSVRPYFRKAGLVQDTNYACGTVFSFNVDNKNNYLWVLATITSDDFHKYTKANSGGTKMPVIKWDTFCKYKVPFPNEQDLKQFNNRLGTVFQYCANLIREKAKLEKIKETLLHKYFD